jgi:hypothetical protein
MHASISAGAFAVPISLDNLPEEMGMYDADMLRPW